MQLRRWTFAVITALLLTGVAVSADTGATARADEPSATRADEATGPGETGLLGPLRIRDMTPFNLLRLDMLPAHAVDAGPGSWAIEAGLSFSNTFVMSDNVHEYLRHRATASGAAPLSAADVEAIQAMGQDAYYVDGEFDLLEATFHYRVRRHTSNEVKRRLRG